jgi:hypothetical protein
VLPQQSHIAESRMDRFFEADVLAVCDVVAGLCGGHGRDGNRSNGQKRVNRLGGR